MIYIRNRKQKLKTRNIVNKFFIYANYYDQIFLKHGIRLASSQDQFLP